MTSLRKPVRRAIEIDGARYVVSLTVEGVELRKARTRTAYLLPWGVALLRAALLATDRARATKRRPARVARGLLRRGA